VSLDRKLVDIRKLISDREMFSIPLYFSGKSNVLIHCDVREGGRTTQKFSKSKVSATRGAYAVSEKVPLVVVTAKKEFVEL
jgi:hypothetical protein